MEILKPSELQNKYNDAWITAYKKELTLVDGDNVEIIEYHPCISGSHWLVHQYLNTSKLITHAYRDGNKHVFQGKVGKDDLDLKASYNAAGIESISVKDDEVRVVHAGLAGAGVGAAMCRGMAKGVKRVELIEEGGGSKLGKAVVITPVMKKLIIGIDDTDVKNKGATWTTAHNIGLKLKEEGFEYLDHIIVQLYPGNPYKTQNCVSIALTFAVFENEKEKLINRLIDLLKEDTLSDKTSIAILEGLNIPSKLVEYSMKTKTGMMSLEEAEKVAEDTGVELISVTGDHGKIGALAALGLYNNHDEAVKVYK